MSRPFTSKLYNISDSDFVSIVRTSTSYTEILKKCGLLYKGGNINTVKRRVKLLGVNDSHIPKGVGSNQNRKFESRQISLKDALEKRLIRGSTDRTYSIKRLVRKYDLIPYKCSCCGNDGMWNGKDLTLQLDHLDGDSSNHSIENLRFLCPNCHSQTETFAGKNSRGKHLR